MKTAFLPAPKLHAMKKISLSLLFAMAFLAGMSQEAPDSRMLPGAKGLFFKRHAIEFRGLYGKWTAPDVVDAISQSVTGGSSLGDNLGSFDITGGGVYGGSIILFPDNKLSIGVDFLVNTNSTQYSYSTGGIANRNYDMKYSSIMGRVDLHYINLHHFKLYGSAALGNSWRKASSGGTTETKTGLAYQITPLGVAVGGMIAGWAELGFGYRGILSAGVAVRF
jgi:hypothetical protein